MIQFFLNRIKSNKYIKQSNENNKNEVDKTVSTNLKENIYTIKNLFNESSDIVYREFTLKACDEKAALIYVDGLIERRILNENVLMPLMQPTQNNNQCDKNNIVEFMSDHLLTVSEISILQSINKIIEMILSGETILLIDNCDSALQINTRGWKSRGIDEPPNESVIRGPREGFVESLRFNTALLRRKIKSPNLVFENLTIGNVSKTDICIAYIKNVTNTELLFEIKNRIKKINIDVLESGYIEQLIEDKKISLFPLIGNTERPDIAAAKLLEGRVAIITDGTPFVLTAPYLFIESLQSSEDYYNKPWLATIIRWIRIISLLLSILLPSLYISTLSYHLEILPTKLLITIASSRSGIPFDPTSELFLMLLFFEVLKEAGIRMPKHVGQAVSIVGGLVLGDAAVKAGLVSNPTVMITAISGICGFIVMPQNTFVTISKFTLVMLANLLGLYGVLVGSIMFLIHLISCKSFSIPYLTPIAPTLTSDLKDVLIKAPIWTMKSKPQSINFSENIDSKKQGDKK